MPWNPDEFVKGGRAGIERFYGKLKEVEEDVEGDYGPQVALYFEEVRIIEAADEVDLEDGEFTDWIKQSSKQNSVNHKMVTEWVEFAKAHKLGPLPDSLYGLDLEWKKATYDYGTDRRTGEALNPGRAFVPVGYAEEEKKPKGKPKGKPKDESKDESSEPAGDLPDDLVEVIMGVIGEDGATRDIIRREVVKKAATRKLMSEAGGLDKVLDAMKEAGHLTNEDEFYFAPES